jgi:hypothetical protein
MDLVLKKPQNYEQDVKLYLDMSVKEFHQQYVKPGEFGVDMSIIALVDHLKVNIAIHTKSGTPRAVSSSVMTFSPAGGSPHTIQILVDLDGKHYEALVPNAPAAAKPFDFSASAGSSSSEAAAKRAPFSANPTANAAGVDPLGADAFAKKAAPAKAPVNSGSAEPSGTKPKDAASPHTNPATGANNVPPANVPASPAKEPGTSETKAGMSNLQKGLIAGAVVTALGGGAAGLAVGLTA